MHSRADKVIREFTSFPHWEEKYRFIIAKGKDLATYPEEYREEKFKVKGCQSQVWLYPQRQESTMFFYGDSDASIVKGIMAILFFVYNNQVPQDILDFPNDFIEKIGLRQHLSLNRANGLGSMLKQMKLYALVFSQSSLN